MDIAYPEIPREIERVAEEMPSISPVLGKINKISQEMDTSPRDLVKVIMLDPVLTGKVIKLVNSSFYGLPQKIQSLAQAVVMLGMNTVKNLAISTAVISSVFIKEKRSPLDPEEFWRHCLAAAAGCRYLAVQMKIAPDLVEMYFIAGLLHDVGKVLFIRTDPLRYKKAIEESNRLGIALTFSELVHFGCTHTQVGALLAKKWKLDSVLVDVIEQHHFLPNTQTPLMKETVMLVNNLCKQESLGTSGNCIIEEMADTLAGRLGLGQDSLNTMVELLPSELDKAAAFLDIVQEAGVE